MHSCTERILSTTTGTEPIRSAINNRYRLAPLLAAAALLIGVAGAHAQTPLSDAIAAYRTGEHDVAVKGFSTLAEKGNPIAQYNLGVMYLTGRGVERDMSQAAKWHRSAAEQGVAMAQYGLGVMYYRGDGIEQDDAKAARWFREAARSTLR